MKLTQDMPDTVKKTLVSVAVGIATIAAGGNIGHVVDAVENAGQGHLMSLAIGVMPDVLLVVVIFKLRYHRRSFWAWAGLGYSVGFIAWASLMSAHGSELVPADEVTRRVVALSPLGFAVIAAGLIETGSAKTATAAGTTDQVTRPAPPRDTVLARPASPLAPRQDGPTVEPQPVAEVRPQRPALVSAARVPARREARVQTTIQKAGPVPAGWRPGMTPELEAVWLAGQLAAGFTATACGEVAGWSKSTRIRRTADAKTLALADDNEKEQTA